MAATTRFLVAGDTGGDLARLFARVGAVNAKHGPFAFLLCVGDFLGAADASAAALAPYLSGQAAVPLPTYEERETREERELDQMRLELRRRRAEPTLLGDPAAPRRFLEGS